MNLEIYNKIKNMDYTQICDLVYRLYNEGFDDSSFGNKYNPLSNLDLIVNSICEGDV